MATVGVAILLNALIDAAQISITSGNTYYLQKTLLISILYAVCLGILIFLSNRYKAYYIRKCLLEMRNILARGTLQANISDYENTGNASYVTTFNQNFSIIEEKVLQNRISILDSIICIVFAVILLLYMNPIIAVVSIFNGSMDIDTDKLYQSIQENISAEQMKNLQLINDTMTEVEKQLDKKELSDCNTQAEVIYLFSLSDKSEDKDFVKSFVSCFKKNQSDEDLINAVNQKFGTEIKYDEFQKMMESIKGAEISTAGFTDKTTKNNPDLVKWCENTYKNGWGYVYGGYGQICTKQYLDQQASLYPGNNEAGDEM